MTDREKQIEEMEKEIDNFCSAIDGECDISCSKCLANFLIKEANYRKIPEGAIMLTKEDMKKYAKDCITGQETGLDIINTLIARAERKKEQAKKETAKELITELSTMVGGKLCAKVLAEKYGVEIVE